MTRFLQAKWITSTQQSTRGYNGQKKIFRLIRSCYTVFLVNAHILISWKKRLCEKVYISV